MYISQFAFSAFQSFIIRLPEYFLYSQSNFCRQKNRINLTLPVKVLSHDQAGHIKTHLYFFNKCSED